MEGAYGSTDGGKAALGVAGTIRSEGPGAGSGTPPSSLNVERVVIAVLLVGLIAVGATAVYFQGQISGMGRSTTMTTTVTTVVNEGPLTFNYSSLPSEFTIGNYTISVWQGTGYTLTTAGGAMPLTYNGSFTVFTIFLFRNPGGESQRVPFFWNTTSTLGAAHPPYNAWCFETSGAQAGSCPYTATAFSGQAEIDIAWTMVDSTIWVSFTFK